MAHLHSVTLTLRGLEGIFPKIITRLEEVQLEDRYFKEVQGESCVTEKTIGMINSAGEAAAAAAVRWKQLRADVTEVCPRYC
jgi:hypothetical protein